MKNYETSNRRKFETKFLYIGDIKKLETIAWLRSKPFIISSFNIGRGLIQMKNMKAFLMTYSYFTRTIFIEFFRSQQEGQKLGIYLMPQTRAWKLVQLRREKWNRL